MRRNVDLDLKVGVQLVSANKRVIGCGDFRYW
jgi:hypothetical protein